MLEEPQRWPLRQKTLRELGCHHHVYVTSGGQCWRSSFLRELDEKTEKRIDDSESPNGEVKGWVWSMCWQVSWSDLALVAILLWDVRSASLLVLVLHPRSPFLPCHSELKLAKVWYQSNYQLKLKTEWAQKDRFMFAQLKRCMEGQRIDRNMSCTVCRCTTFTVEAVVLCQNMGK